MIITNLLLFILLLHYTRPLGTNLLYHLLSAVQRIFIYYFYEGNIGFAAADIFGWQDIMRAAILINATVLFISAFKIFKRYLEEKDRNDKASSELIEIKADKRIHLVKIEDILYLEGMGNYVTYHTRHGKKLIAYTSMKQALKQLPPEFKRIHKSYIITGAHVFS